VNIVPSSLIISIVSFLILYWLLDRYAFSKLFGIMEKRREIVMTELKSAEENRKSSEALIAEQKKELEATRKEAYEIMERAKQTANRQTEESLAQARAEAARIKDEALRDIESEKNKAIAALRSQVSAMSVMIASKIIEKQVDEKSQQALIDQYLKEVGGKV
jgi:F-type H+-transporting ATPase subunit b